MQARRRIQIAIQIPAVVINDVGIFCHKAAGLVFDEFDARYDGGTQLLQLSIIFPGNIIYDAVNIALRVKIVGRYAHQLCALLPGEVVFTGDVRQTLGLDGVKHRIAHRQDKV